MEPSEYLIVSSGGMLGGGTSSTIEDVRRTLRNAVQKKPKNGLLVHFHGELDTEPDARASAVSLANKYASAETYPIFFIWRSGLLETIQVCLQKVGKRRHFQELVKLVSEWTGKKSPAASALVDPPVSDGNLAAFRAAYDAWFNGLRSTPPVADASLPFPVDEPIPEESELAARIQEGLASDPDFMSAFAELELSLRTQDFALLGQPASLQPDDASFLDPAAAEQLFPEYRASAYVAPNRAAIAAFAAPIVVAVLSRIFEGRDHGLYTTIVEEVLRHTFLDAVGKDIWKQMKDDTSDAFNESACAVGTVFQRTLESEDPTGVLRRVTLVGHNAGRRTYAIF
jgi:hypothetical protein